MTKEIVRGSTLFVVVVFYDENGAVFTPSGATFRVGYYAQGVWQTISMAMTSDDSGNWSATWDTSPADAGNLFWWAKSDGSPAAACQGQLALEANGAALQT